jgi:hypothetical protein
MEAALVPKSDEWRKNMWYIYTVEYSSGIKKQNYVVCRKMNKIGDHSVELDSQAQKDKYSICFCSYAESRPKKNMTQLYKRGLLGEGTSRSEEGKRGG